MTLEILNNRYRVTQELGKGGMGRVCLVEDLHRDNMPLALKTQLLPDGDPALLESFLEEFAGVVKLRHPNVAAAYDFGVIAGTGEHYFTTEFIRGVELLPGTEECSHDELLDVVRQVLQGLDFLHSNGYLHNDLKPANILLAEPDEGGEQDRHALDQLQRKVFGVRGRVKIIDFGLLTRENVAWSNIRGTPQYLCPERINCDPADRRSDLYSIGCVFYHLAARRPPFRHRDVRELLKLHLHESPAPVQQFCSDLPEPLVKLIDKLMQKQPQQRFEDAGSALRYLGGELGWDSRSYEVQARTPDVDVGALLFRDRELQQLQARLQSLLEGKLVEPSVIIEGDAGVGKSRLVEEIRGSVQTRGGVFTVLRGQGVQGHLEPVLSAFEGALKTAGVPGLDAVRPLLDQAGEQGDLAYLLIETMVHFAQKLPIVLHVDDFHMASQVVRHFILELADTAAEKARSGHDLKLMIVVCRRTDCNSEALQMGEPLRLDLRPFTNTHSRQFVQRIFNDKDIPEGVVSSLVGIAQGNPALLLRLAQELVARRIVTFRGSRWSFPTSLNGVPLPDSIAGAVRARIETLDEDESTLLRWLSLCHAPVTSDLLCRVSYVPASTTEKSLRTLVREGLVTFETRVTITEVRSHSREQRIRRYSFGDRELQKEVREKIDTEQRRDMHHRLAQMLEELERALDPGALAELLSYHWYQSGNRAAFLRYARDAADYLQRCGNFSLAARYHRKLVKGMPESAIAKKIQSLLKLSEMHDFLWDLDRVEKNLGDILELGQVLLKAKDRAALLRRLAGVELARQRHDRALAHLDQANELLAGQRTDLVAFSIEAPRAWALWFGKGPDHAAEAIAKANELYTRVKPNDAKERALLLGAAHHLANLNWVAGTTNVALRIYRENLAALNESQQQARAACICAIGSCLLAAGNPQEALEALEAARDLGRELGDLRLLSRVRERLGEYHCFYGDLKNALQVTQLALADARDIGNDSAEGNSLRMLGRIHLRAGQPQQALKSLEEAVAHHAKSADVVELSLSKLYLARVLTLCGRQEEAETLLEEAQRLAREYRILLPRGLCELFAARLAAKRGDAIDHERLEQLQQSFEKLGLGYQGVETALFHADVCSELGRVEDASRLLLSIRDQVRQAGSWRQRAEFEILTARLAVESGRFDEAQQMLERVLECTRRWMLPDLRQRAQEALKSIMSVKH